MNDASQLVTAAVTPSTGTPMELRSLRLNGPRDDEVLVNVIACGICHTDIGMRDSATRVPKPVVLGHEGAGIVERVGRNVRRVKEGDHVVMSFNSCGLCKPCLIGAPAYCEAGVACNFACQRGDGTTAFSTQSGKIHSHFFGQSSFATHAICTERNAIVVRRDIPLKMLGPLGCGFQTGAGAVLNSLRVSPGSVLAIFGAGSVGLAAVMAAKIAGASQVIAVDTQPHRLEMAVSLGATATIDAASEDVAPSIRRLAIGGIDFALDTTGSTAVIRQAIDLLAPRGTCGLISSAKGADASFNVLDLMLGGKTIRGVVQGDCVPEVFIPMMVDFHLQGRFPFDRLLSFYRFADINQAVMDMESGKVIKPVLVMP